MNHRKITSAIFILALLALGVSYFFSGTMVCDNYTWACNGFFLQVRSLLFVLSLPLIFLSPILFFVRREAFMAWAKFASVAFPLMLGILLYIFNNTPSVNSGWVNLGTQSQLASTFFPPLVVIISLGIIIYKQLRAK